MPERLALYGVPRWNGDCSSRVLPGNPCGSSSKSSSNRTPTDLTADDKATLAMFDLQNDDVPDGGYWTKLQRVSAAGIYGEPFFEMLIGATVGKWLVDNALVEEVTDRPWPSRKPCYRITELGDAVLKRGPQAHPQPKRPPLRMSQPRVRAAEPRIKPR